MIHPLFISSAEGPLFIVVYTPDAQLTQKGWVVHVPAFGEEMNKARAMVSRQARKLTEQGYAVVVPDLHGTGDSAGELRDFTWQRWQADIVTVIDWIGGQGGQNVALWGLRLGCLLALSVARDCGRPINHLLLWQPVLLGQQYVNQFLRLRVAAGLFGKQGESTAMLRERLDEGETLEVAGYDLSPEMVHSLDALKAENIAPPTGVTVSWLEVASGEGKELTPASRRVQEAWASAGVEIQSEIVPGDAFWTTQEITLVPRLLQVTVDQLETTEFAVSAPPGAGADSAWPTRDESEQPLLFDCDGEQLTGILHRAQCRSDIGVLVVVGGPQYRVGSHRQFVYLARDLARLGFPVLRFDYRGMGDSSGELRDFQYLDADISRAIDEMQRLSPRVNRVVIWGLCDAATAASFYAAKDSRVCGLVLLNPWVRSEQGQARAYIRHYYIQRLLDREFWQKLFSGKFALRDSFASLGANFRNSLGSAEQSPIEQPDRGGQEAQEPAAANLIERMYSGLVQFSHPVLVILSGNDLTAAEFRDASGANRKLRKLFARAQFTHREITEADHTFSRRVWRDEVAGKTADWLTSL